MQFQTAKAWWVPYGTWIILSHSEACHLTSGISREAIKQAIEAIGSVYATIAAIAIDIQCRYIREKNEQSGGAGVKLLFNWGLGVITSIVRRGSGSSPCSPAGSGGVSGPGGGGPLQPPKRMK